jgi:hypothetical protein
MKKLHDNFAGLCEYLVSTNSNGVKARARGADTLFMALRGGKMPSELVTSQAGRDPPSGLFLCLQDKHPAGKFGSDE